MAEIAMVRLFLMIENTLASVAEKLLCGAAYVDGTPPGLLTGRVSTMSAARSLMSNYDRLKARRLTWTEGMEIRENVRTTLDVRDAFVDAMRTHAALMTQMRYVRNHIAHGNEGSRRNFRKVVRTHYGALKPGVTPGLLLLSTKGGGSTQLEVYLVSARVLIKDATRA